MVIMMSEVRYSLEPPTPILNVSTHYAYTFPRGGRNKTFYFLKIILDSKETYQIITEFQLAFP